MAHRIAFVDDDTVLSAFYLDALRALGYEPVHFKSPDSCFTAIDSGATFDLFITDLMMPSYGRYDKSLTSNDLKTGVVFAQDLRSADAEVPIIVVTNLNVDTLYDTVRIDLSKLANLFVVKKSAFPPSVLADSIHALLASGIPLEDRRGALHRLWDGLLLEPNFLGIGVKLKELFRKSGA